MNFAKKLLWKVGIACLLFPFYVLPLMWIKEYIHPSPPWEDDREFMMAIPVFMALGILLLIIASLIAFAISDSTKDPEKTE